MTPSDEGQRGEQGFMNVCRSLAALEARGTADFVSRLSVR